MTDLYLATLARWEPNNAAVPSPMLMTMCSAASIYRSRERHNAPGYI